MHESNILKVALSTVGNIIGYLFMMASSFRYLLVSKFKCRFRRIESYEAHCRPNFVYAFILCINSLHKEVVFFSAIPYFYYLASLVLLLFNSEYIKITI